SDHPLVPRQAFVFPDRTLRNSQPPVDVNSDPSRKNLAGQVGLRARRESQRMIPPSLSAGCPARRLTPFFLLAATGSLASVLPALARLPLPDSASSVAPAPAARVGGHTTTPTPVLCLHECLQLALEQQPRIAAARASLAVAEDAYRAL